MSQKELKRMKDTRRESHKVFNFGTSSYKSKGIIEIPVTLKGRKFYLRTEVLGDIPWLIGKKTMSNMGMMLNLKEYKVCIGVLGGIEVELIEDKQGHLRIPIRKRIVEEELLLEGWKGKSQKEIKGAIMKLHLQFEHGSGDKIWKLTEAQWSEGLRKDEKKEMRKLSGRADQ